MSESDEPAPRRGRISISIPADVEQLLDGVENASAYIADAVRLKAKRDRFRAMVASHGYNVTDEGIARAGEKLRAAEARRDAARRAA